MDELFNKTEYEQLLINALWSDEETQTCPHEWIEELENLSRYFIDRPRSPDFSGTAGSIQASRAFFAVFLQHIEESVAKRCLEAGVDMTDLLSPGALLAYETGLLEFCAGHWSSVCDQVLRKAGFNPLRVYTDQGASEYIFSGGLFHDCCMAYPMFTRLFCEYILSVIDELSGLISILALRRSAIYIRLCSPGANPNTVPVILSLGESVSDRHSGGRSVHIITFTDGKKVVFKPHSSQIDLAFAGWLNFLADASGDEPFETADTVDFGAYSFYRYVSPYSFRSEEEVARFFYREGFLLGAVYSLRGRDLHCENIIAAKDPVVVDGEALIEVPENVSDSGFSVMSTTILPLCSSRPGYHKELCGACDTCSGAANLPVLNGKAYSAYDFPDEMISGFKAATEVILNNMPAAAEAVRRLFTGVHTRTIILPSYSYEYTLLALNTPRRLRSAAEAEHVINILLDRKAEKVNETEQREKRITIERTALRQLDIPMLYVTLDSTGISAVISRIEKFSRYDLDRQQKYIRFLIDKSSPLRNAPAHAYTDLSDDDSFRTLAKQTLDGFEGVYHIAVPREDREPRFTLGGTAFLEGRLGVAIALEAYLVCFENTGDPLCEMIRTKLLKYIETLSGRKDGLKAFSILEPGLAEGIGGMLSGAYLLFRSGLICEELFRAVAEGILQSTEQALDTGRVFSVSNSFLFGFNGLKYTLDRMCSLGGLPEDIAKRAEEAAFRLGREISYPYAAVEKMLCSEINEAYSRFDSSLLVRELSVPFPGLFYGTSGKLFRLCARRHRLYSPEINLPLFEFFHYSEENT